TWTVDTKAPDTSIDSATDGNSNHVVDSTNTSSNSITFTFSGTPSEDVDHFECSIDGSAFTTNPEDCDPNGTTYEELDDGPHTFAVRAVDAEGNADAEPATFTWTVDTTAPDTSIDSATDGNSNPVVDSTTTPSNSITFTFSGTPSEDVDHFECSIDGSAFTTNPEDCDPNGTTYEELDDGPHTFAVRAVDAVGNADAEPATFTWTVDTTAPDTSIDSATDGNDNSVADGDTTPSNSITFTFSGTPAEDVNHFECSIDGSDYVACTSGIEYTELSDGEHTFAVRAVDAVGNADAEPATFTWTVDTTAPDTSIDSATDGNDNSVADGDTTPSNSITFTFSGTPAEDVNHFECSIDGSAF